jgi:hypothetical protein
MSLLDGVGAKFAGGDEGANFAGCGSLFYFTRQESQKALQGGNGAQPSRVTGTAFGDEA